MSQLELIRPRQMTRWQRLTEAVRSITLGPFNPKDRTIARYFGGSPSLSGISVNEDSALTISAVWSAVTMISDDIASLPLMLYKRLPNGGKDRFEQHPLYRLLHDAPNPEMDSMVWRRTMQAHVLIWQNAYAEIERDAAGRPVAIWPLVPESVSVIRQNGRIRYRVQNPGGSEVILMPEDVIHLVGHSYDGSVGCSLVRYAKESLGLTLATEQYGASFFGNGATMGGVVSIKGPRPNDQVEKGHRDQLEARHRGVERAHKLLLLYNDSTYTPNVIAPNQGQFNETRVLQIREIARWFKMPPHKLGDLADATYSNVEQMDAAYLSSCIRPWLVLWQQQLSRKLIAKLEQRQQFIEHETHGFLSVDAASRAQLYTSEFNIGAVQINEIRGYENRDPIKGGDRAFIPLNMIPLDRVDEWIDAQIKSKEQPQPAPQLEPKAAETDDDADRQIEALSEQLQLARKAVQLAEDAKDLATARYEATAATLNTVTAERDTARAAQQQAEHDANEAEALALRERESKDVVVRSLEAVTAEREAVAAAGADAVNRWRSFAQFVFLGGGEATGTDKELQDQLCAAVERDAAEARAAKEQADKDRDAACALVLQAEQERDEAKADRDRLRASADDAVAALNAEIVGLKEAIDLRVNECEAAKATLAQAEADREAALTLAAQAEQERDDARAALTSANTDLAAKQIALDVEVAKQMGWSAERDTLTTEADRMRVDRDAALALAAQAEQERDEAKAALSALNTEHLLKMAAQQLTIDGVKNQAQGVTVERDMLMAETETLKADLARARADLATELDQQRTHKTVMLAAMRSLFADATERLVQREIDRARKHQATPEKFRAWLGTFYPVHADVVRQTFRPLVGPWTAVTGGAPTDLLERLVSQHIEHSTQALQQILETEDEDQRASLLERTFRRWEDERGDQVADALVREGMGA